MSRRILVEQIVHTYWCGRCGKMRGQWTEGTEVDLPSDTRYGKNISGERIYWDYCNDCRKIIDDATRSARMSGLVQERTT